MRAYTYILLCSGNKYYVGSTTNLELRLKEHFAEADTLYGSRFTKGYKPIKLVYKEEYTTIAEAFKRERQLHGWSHAKKEALIRGDFELLKSLSKTKGGS